MKTCLLKSKGEKKGFEKAALYAAFFILGLS